MRPASILVVDDHEVTRDFLEFLLRTEGYELTMAADGEQAAALYRRHPTDVVLLDIFLPHKDGIQTILELRGEFPDVAIIAMSADGSFGRQNALARARDAGRRTRRSREWNRCRRAARCAVRSVRGSRCRHPVVHDR